jgi:hypothetical protein
MNERLGLRLLAEIMKWPDEIARREFEWLRLMARVKYDSYEDFRAGARFLERLAIWLQQFLPKDRQLAYDFLRDRLIYIGPQEMQLLVERLYPEHVERDLIQAICSQMQLPTYNVWRSADAVAALKRSRRRILFMALSDGARIDELRRSNAGILSNEQIVVATQLDTSKWQELYRKLRKEQGDKEAQFERICLIDDFIASGTTLLRYEEDEKKWDGKIIRFRDTLRSAEAALEGTANLTSLPIHIHHYLSTARAQLAIGERIAKMKVDKPDEGWIEHLSFSFGYTLPVEVVFGKQMAAPFNPVIENYYDPAIESVHSAVSGVKSLMYGYAECGLPLVLEHNTPNNSLPLLWAETDGNTTNGVHPMKPLFRRRQRHT